MKYFLLSALFLAGCATPQDKHVNDVATNWAQAYIGNIMLAKCPQHFRLKPETVASYHSNLKAANNAFGANYASPTLNKLRHILKKPGACAKIADNYDVEEAGKVTFIEEKK